MTNPVAGLYDHIATLLNAVGEHFSLMPARRSAAVLDDEVTDLRLGRQVSR